MIMMYSLLTFGIGIVLLSLLVDEDDTRDKTLATTIGLLFVILVLFAIAYTEHLTIAELSLDHNITVDEKYDSAKKMILMQRYEETLKGN